MAGRLEDGSSLPTPAGLQAFIETAPDAFAVVDAHGRIAMANSLTERMFGYSRNELLGSPIELLVPARYQAQHAKHRASYFDEPRTRPMGAGLELAGRRKDGTEFPVEISLSPLLTDAGVLVSAAIRDISQRKLVEDQLRASLREKEVLLREVHHRVKNNLQIVSSILSLQMERIAETALWKLFAESQARIRSIALFHEKLYESEDLSRVDVADYLTRLVTSLTASVDARRIALHFELENVPMSVDSAISCGLVVNELVSNALRHGFPDDARGDLRIALRRSGDEAVLEVADDGVGFPPDFDLSAPSTLGLKLVHTFVEQMGGRLERDDGAGVCIRVRFPVGESP